MEGEMGRVRGGGERIAEKDEVIFKGRAEMVESKNMTHF